MLELAILMYLLFAAGMVYNLADTVDLFEGLGWVRKPIAAVGATLVVGFVAVFALGSIFALWIDKKIDERNHQ